MSCCSTCGEHACACCCGVMAGTPLPLYNRPGLDSLGYRVGTYADFRATMQGDLSDAALPALAGLRTRDADDPAMALLDAWAVGADVLSFYTERIANEAYLRTATERRSVLELARLVDYRLRPGVAASGYLAYVVEKDSPPVIIPAGARAQSVPAPGEQMQTFETAEPLEARFEWNALQPRLTRPQNISLDTIAGLDALWIASTASNLKPNDRLLFLFGDLVTGTQAIRRVQSVQVQQLDQRSKVMLQPLDPATVLIVTAANAAITALSGSDAGPHREQWLGELQSVRRQLLLEGGNGGSYDALVGRQFHFVPGPLAIDDFKSAVDAAFGAVAPPPPAAGGFGALFGALTRVPGLQPANRFYLQRSVATALGKVSDVRPQLLLKFESHLADTFYRAWTSVPQGQPSPALSSVSALRMSAPLFGYNAPKTIAITQQYVDSVWTSQTVATELTADENEDVLFLDNGYDGVLAGSYVLIVPPADALTPHTVAQVRSVQIHPRTAYGVSGKTTEIGLVDAHTAGQPAVWPAPSMATLRGTQVYAQSEPLALAELVIADTVGRVAANDGSLRSTRDSATRLTLDAPLDGLKAGRWVIVEGRRSDVPGTDAVSAAELVMLAAVEQGTDAQLPGDTVHSTLVFANQGLAYSYRRDSVSVYANVVRATHGETRTEVLGSGSGALAMQAFALKQSPLTYVSATTVDGVRSTLSVTVNDMRWHETRNLAFAGADARSFVSATDDDGKIRLTFGDGTHGARLPTGIENIRASYRNGIGTPGNVRAGQISLLATRPLGVKAVFNPLRTSGGADAESRDQARRNVPLAVLALDRLVSVSDYADFARTFGGVGKAAAIKLGAIVQLTIAGADDAPIEVSSDLYRNLLQALQRYGDPLLPLRLDVRELLALTLSARVGLAADYVWESVEPRLRSALLDAFGFERRALAQNVYLSEIVTCMQAVRGVAWVDVDAFGSLDEATLLAGFGDRSNGKRDGGEAGLSSSNTTAATAPPSRVQVLPARHGSDGTLYPAQLAYLPPGVPDTLLLQEATA